ncbi:MAG TPA: NifU family protein [Bacteroidota bacterium]|jgi:Fe-S cluster biogenesis protein NfuA|nr:NifU family protein [Bacteroidota bacterium]
MPGDAVSSVRERVEAALAVCRPYLQADQGDVELVSVSEEGIVELRLLGTCVICPMSRMTLRAGIERAIMRRAPEVKRIEQIK